MKGQRWLLRALGIFLVLLVVWIAAALLLNSAAAGTISLPMNLQTHLLADYGGDSSIGPLGAFRLSIVGEAMRDQGMPENEIMEHSLDVKESMDDPVPTATARNFEGDDPFTATPTMTFTPTTTFTPTVTNTPTPIPTNTPKPTDTPKPKKKKPTKTTEPVESPEPCIDEEAPAILGDWFLDPEPGEVSTCSVEVEVGELHIRDESYSAGIDWVKLKYYDPVGGSWEYSSPLNPSPPSGWELGETWDAYYGLSMCVTASPACSTTHLPNGSSPLLISIHVPSVVPVEVIEVPVHAYVMDNAGNSSHRELGVYELPASCIE
jgi:hypothetical protein